MNYLKNLNKNQKIVGGLLVGVLLVGGYLYRGNILNLITNNYYDYTEEYIVRPDLALFKPYEWATWRDSVSGRMAHDPNWFKLPPDKYIPKEVPFDWKTIKDFTALEKRNAYYKHLCQTESVAYITDEYPKDFMGNNDSIATSTWLYIRNYEPPIKNIKELEKKNPELAKPVFKIAYQNPFINPNFGYLNWNEKMTLKWDFRKADDNYYKLVKKMNFAQPAQDTFREYVLWDGRVFRIRFNTVENKFLPLQQIELKDSQARYYSIYREIDRPEMKKLGIYGQENISLDRSTGRIISYRKHFRIPAYYASLRGTNLDIPIDWISASACGDKAKEIKDFN